MAAISIPSHGVMEGKGAYNRHAKLQAGGVALALPLLQQTVQQLEPGCRDEPLVIADYGSSQGKNSLAPMRIAIEKLRERAGPHRAIFVFHVDQPTNDFNTLLRLLNADPDTYTAADQNVFPCAIGKSFYQRVLPPDSVHLGWSSYAAVWLSRIPARIPDHFISIFTAGSERAAYQLQAARDWQAFLSLRAKELRIGGRLVVVLPARSDDGIVGLENLMHHANAVLAEMVREGAVGAQERARMVLGCYPRQTSELLAPFQADGHFEGLAVEACELLPLPDSAWAEYERDGNEEALATKRALFFRSTFVSSLSLGLDRCEDAERRRVFAERFENLLKRRLVKYTEPLHSFVHIFVASKRSERGCQPEEHKI